MSMSIGLLIKVYDLLIKVYYLLIKVYYWVKKKVSPSGFEPGSHENKWWGSNELEITRGPVLGEKKCKKFARVEHIKRVKILPLVDFGHFCHFLSKKVKKYVARKTPRFTTLHQYEGKK